MVEEQPPALEASIFPEASFQLQEPTIQEETTPPMPSWLGDDGYCIYDNTTSAGYTCQSATNMYMAAAYWSVMTITSVGYGDIAATPFNPTEQAVCIALMLVSSLIYAQVIGTYCGVVANLNPEATAFRETLDDLNRFMTREELPNEMRQRLREYFATILNENHIY